MAALSEQTVNSAKRAARGLLRRAALASGMQTELNRVHARVAELEREVQESRRLQQRVAELTDVIAEILVPAANRDEDKLKAALKEYEHASF
jgi:hypothetical protein